jgi:hypothetical protein
MKFIDKNPRAILDKDIVFTLSNDYNTTQSIFSLSKKTAPQSCCLSQDQIPDYTLVNVLAWSAKP